MVSKLYPKKHIIERVKKILDFVGANGVRPDAGSESKTGACHAPLHETDIASLEAEIDRLVYGLYGLTEEEIGVVEGKSGL